MSHIANRTKNYFSHPCFTKCTLELSHCNAAQEEDFCRQFCIGKKGDVVNLKSEERGLIPIHAN